MNLKKWIPLCLGACVCFATLQPPAFAAEASQGTQMIIRVGNYDSVTGPTEYFTGKVCIDNLFPAKAPARFSGGYVTFEPGARSAWHTHMVGQTLLVTVGVGLT